MNTTPNTRSIDIIHGAEQAMALMQLEPSMPGDDDAWAEHIFSRELPKSALSHFDWFYLLSTLLALMAASPAGALPPQPASGASAQA